MSTAQFEQVTVLKQASISYDGRCSSHTVLFEDGRKKMIGIILPCDDEVAEYIFETHTSERMEIIAGECEVKINGEAEFNYYRTGQAFMVEGDSGFTLRTEQIVEYVCHLEV